MSGLPADVDAALANLARTDSLLVASDYDGTISPLVSDPAAARPLAGSVAALRRLAELPHSHAALISGRSLRDLVVLSGLPEQVHFAGSHGSEFESGFAVALGEQTRELLEQIADSAQEIALTYPNVTVEAKPVSIAIHYRNVIDELRVDVRQAIEDGPCALPGVHLTYGKDVVELAVIDTDKGYALDRIREQVGATAVVFFGDDITDEKAFDRLRSTDVGVKVGAGPSRATLRIDDPESVADALTRLAELRESFLSTLV